MHRRDDLAEISHRDWLARPHAERHAGPLQQFPGGRHLGHYSAVEPLSLDRARLRALIEAAGEALNGDWVLLGGAVAALCFRADRVTEDIDLVPLGGAAERRYELMDFALSEGLPVEAVNSAADFFLRREPGWQDDLELLHVGSTAKIFRPKATLFLVLKCGRMSEADLADCVAQIAEARGRGCPIDAARVLARIDAADRASGDEARRRRARLRDALKT